MKYITAQFQALMTAIIAFAISVAGPAWGLFSFPARVENVAYKALLLGAAVFTGDLVHLIQEVGDMVSLSEGIEHVVGETLTILALLPLGWAAFALIGSAIASSLLAIGERVCAVVAPIFRSIRLPALRREPVPVKTYAP